MSAPLFTYVDAVEHLLDVFYQEGRNVGSQDRRLRRAVHLAYQKLPELHDWNYFRGITTIQTEIPQSVSATYTSADLLVTLASGTWPTNVRFGLLEISGQRYRIRRKVSTTVVELVAGPSADVTGTFKWVRLRYLLPDNVGEVVSVTDPAQRYMMRRVPPESSFWWESATTGSAYPLLWSVFPSADYPGRFELWLQGAGETVKNLDVLYRRRFTNLPIYELSSGTVSVENDDAVFTASILTDDCIGAVLRVSATTDKPTGQFGQYHYDTVTGDETVDRLVAAASEAIITHVTDATNAILNIDDLADSDSKAFTISSHIDVNTEVMKELFLRLCEEQYDIISRAEPVVRNLSHHARMEALKIAMMGDAKGPAHFTPPRYQGDINIVEDS